MLKISQTTWTQSIQLSQFQLVSEPAELHSTLKPANHHAKLQMIVQEPMFNQFQDQLLEMTKLENLFMDLLWREVMLHPTEETSQVILIHNPLIHKH